MPPRIAEDHYLYLVRVTKVSPSPAGDEKTVPPLRAIEFASEIRRTWMFQSNPALYDLRAALRGLKDQVWSVSRYAREIRIGDRVYLWEAGRDGGIIARAEVFEPPCLRPEAWEQLPFIKAHDLFLKERMRTKIRVAQIFEPLIPRQSIVERPEFRGLSVLRCSRGTNFRLSEAEAEAIEELIHRMAA